MNDEFARKVFFEIHSGLSREAPGGAEHTRRALGLLPELPRPVRVLDIGCGPGAQSLVLAREVDGSVVAVDNHEPFLEALRMRAQAEGLADRIEARDEDMFDLPFAAGSFDLIWSEGSIYVIGFEKGLRTWRPLLKDGGCIALTECVWLTANAPDACREFWDMAYPTMADRESNLVTARARASAAARRHAS